MAEAKIDISLNAGNAPQTLGELEEKAERLTEQLKQTKIGTNEYKNLQQELVQTTKKVKNLELGFEALDREQVAAELGGVAGAVGDITSAVVLLGGENENLEQMVANIEKGIGISMAFKGAIEGASSAWKLLNNVMRANPIGLIITAVAALIAGIILLVKNWDKLNDIFVESGSNLRDLTSRMGKYKNAVLLALGPIGLMIWAYEKLSKAQAENMTQAEKDAAREERLRKAQGKAARKRHQERVNQIKEEQELRRKQFNEEQEIFDLEIDRMEAEGKNANALKKAKIEATVEEKENELKTIRDLLDSWTQYYEDLFRISGKSREDFLAMMKGQGIDLEALQKEANDRIEKAQREIFAAETELIRFNREVRESAHEETIEEIEEESELEKTQQEERLKLLQEIEKAENEFLNSKLSKEDQEINKVREKYFILIEEARQHNIDTLLLEEAFESELTAVKERFADERKRIAQQEQDEINKARQESIDMAKQGAQDLFNAANGLQQLLADKELKRAQEKTARGEKLTKEEIKRLERQDKIQKAFALAQIAADTARAVTGVIAGATQAAAAAGPGFPFVLAGYIASGLAAVISGATQAAAILGEAPDIPSADSVGGGFGDAASNNQTVPDLQSAEFGSTLLNPQQVYVVESDITDTQNSVAVIEAQATFG